MEKGDGMANNQFLVFTKRPSGNRGIGGRGEYELAGEATVLSLQSLLASIFTFICMTRIILPRCI